jgi:hypothetical protein
MIKTSDKKRLTESISSLMNKYDMFFTNHQYKSSHFKSQEEYTSIQKSLSREIQFEENLIRDILKRYFSENFENLEFVLYDSRTICITKIFHKIGDVLIKGIPEDENEIIKIKNKFNMDTDLTISITRWESLDEESRTKLMEYLK